MEKKDIIELKDEELNEVNGGQVLNTAAYSSEETRYVSFGNKEIKTNHLEDDTRIYSGRLSGRGSNGVVLITQEAKDAKSFRRAMTKLPLIGPLFAGLYSVFGIDK